MHNDQPTLPNLRGYDVEAPGGMPPWLGANEYPRRSSTGDWHSTLLGVSLGANVALLIGLVSLLLLGRAGFFSPGGSAASPPQGTVASSTALGSPSATSSATPAEGWLHVAPSTVRLGCGGGQDTQYAVLMNSGTERVQWQVAFSVPGDQAGVVVSPTHGDLAAGASATLQLQSRSDAGAQQGVIRFDPATSAAGSSPTLSYTTMNCH
jgi:hypothetical protein